MLKLLGSDWIFRIGVVIEGGGRQRYHRRVFAQPLTSLLRPVADRDCLPRLEAVQQPPQGSRAEEQHVSPTVSETAQHANTRLIIA